MRQRDAEQTDETLSFYPHAVISISALKMDLLKRVTTNKNIERLFRIYDETTGHELGKTFVQEGQLHSIEDWLRRIMILMNGSLQEHRTGLVRVRAGDYHAQLVKALSEHTQWVTEQACSNLHPDNLNAMMKPYARLEDDYQALSLAHVHLTSVAAERADQLGQQSAEFSSKESALTDQINKLISTNADLQRKLDANMRSPLTEITEEKSLTNRLVRFSEPYAPSSFSGSICGDQLAKSYAQSIIADQAGKLSSKVMGQREDFSLFMSPFTTLCMDMLRLLPRSEDVSSLTYRLPLDTVSGITSGYLPKRPHLRGLKFGVTCTLVPLHRWLPKDTEVPSDVQISDGEQVVLDQLALFIGTERIPEEMILNSDMLDFHYRYQMLSTKAEVDHSDPEATKKAIAELDDLVAEESSRSEQPLTELFNKVFAAEISLGSATPTPSKLIPQAVINFLMVIRNQPGFDDSTRHYCAGLPPIDAIGSMGKDALTLHLFKANKFSTMVSNPRYYIGNDSSMMGRYTEIFNKTNEARSNLKSSKSRRALLGGSQGTFRSIQEKENAVATVSPAMGMK